MIYSELEEAAAPPRRLGCPVIDVSELSVEETAMRIIRLVEKRKQARDEGVSDEPRAASQYGAPGPAAAPAPVPPPARRARRSPREGLGAVPAAWRCGGFSSLLGDLVFYVLLDPDLAQPACSGLGRGAQVARFALPEKDARPHDVERSRRTGRCASSCGYLCRRVLMHAERVPDDRSTSDRS